MPMYIPKRVFINSKCVGLPKTEAYLKRIRKWNPSVEERQYEGEFTYPAGFTPHDMFHYGKESILINERSTGAPFILSFPSPGYIVEDFTTVVNLTWQCASKCHYCYLMLTRPYEKYFYTNLERFEDELATAPYAHRAILTLWTMVSHATKTSFMKVPYYLYRASDQIRADCVQNGVVSDEEALQFLLQHSHHRIYETLQREWKATEGKTPFPIGEQEFQFSESTIRKWYGENSKRPLELTISEFTDLVAVDHLTGNLDYILGLLPKYPDVELVVRTKSTYFEEMLAHDGLGRVHIAMNFNTARAINSYEPVTSTLEERIQAFKLVQASSGYHPSVVIEPIIPYDGCVEDYKNLVHHIMRSIDPLKLSSFTIGAVRYKVDGGNLMIALTKNFPDSDILNTPETLQEAEPLDGRRRYTEAFREHIYDEMIKVFRQYNTSAHLHLGTEKHTLWDVLNLDRFDYISHSVYQYNSTGTSIMEPMEPAGQDQAVEPQKKQKIAQVQPTLQRQLSSKFQIATLAIGSTNKQKVETFADMDKLKEADALLEVYDKETGKERWDNVFSHTIQKALQEEYYTPVKIIGWIGDITAPMPIKPRNRVQEQQLKLRGFEIRIVDSDRRELRTLIAPIEAFGIDLYDMKQMNRRMVFCGAIVVINVHRSQEPRLFLWNVIPSCNAEDLIGVDKNYDATPLNQIYEQESQKPHGMFNYIRKQVIEKSGIKGVEDFPELGKCVDVMIYQAFSDGMNAAPRYSNKIHTLIIGPPGIGKKFLIEIARMLNPVFNNATAVSGKISVAGLVGTVVGAGAKRISQPGFLPLSSGGVLALPDFHQLQNNRAAVLGALSEAMEDGRVTDSNSPKTSHEAETSLHLDLNRSADVDPSKVVDTYSDVNIPYNIISRFDFIIDLPGNLETRLKPIEETFSKETVLSSYPTREQQPRWQRDLQRLIAHMRTYWRDVTIPQEVNAYAYARIKDEFGLMNGQSTLVDQDVLQSNIARTARAVHKFIKAITCADHNPTATKEDVDRAIEFIREKIKFLSKYREARPAPSDPRKRRIQNRLDRIIEAFGNRKFTTGDVVKIQDPSATEEQIKTIRQQVTRDLGRLESEGLIERVRQGTWQVAVGEHQSVSKSQKKIAKGPKKGKKVQIGKKLNGRNRKRKRA